MVSNSLGATYLFEQLILYVNVLRDPIRAHNYVCFGSACH